MLTEKTYTIKCNVSEEKNSSTEKKLEKSFERMIEDKVSQLKQAGKNQYRNWLFKVKIED